MTTVSSAAGPDRSRRRLAADRRPEVLAALRKNGGFMSAQGLHAWMRRQGIRIGLTAVYRALSAADAEGRFEAVHALSGAKGYRYLPPVHEHHLTCRVCGVGIAFFCQCWRTGSRNSGPVMGSRTCGTP